MRAETVSSELHHHGCRNIGEREFTVEHHLAPVPGLDEVPEGLEVFEVRRVERGAVRVRMTKNRRTVQEVGAFNEYGHGVLSGYRS